VTETTTLESVDINRLMQLLPHRYPFLMIDRIVDINGDESCVGIKNVTFNEPHFQGHFPGRPIMPGVLLIEAMAQTAGALWVHANSTDKPQLVYFVTIDNCKFRKPVVPGDQVRIHIQKIKGRKGIWWFRGVARVDDVIVAEADVSAVLADA
jgi:3-hydroxyacyl-[acyl-carrier-protein] dehydratase